MSKSLRRGEGSVRPYTLASGEVRYRARWREGGRLQSKSFETEQAANAHLIGMSTDKRLGRHIQMADLTVKDAVLRYLRRSEHRWAQNTSATYGQIAKSHIYPHIGREQLSVLSTSRVQEWLDLLTRKKLSPSVVGNARIILSGACSELVRMGELSRSPVTGVRIPPKKRKVKETWNAEHVGKVYRAARELYPQMEVYYRVALTTAMRPGELRALKWSDIDFEKSRMRVQRTVTRNERGRQILGETTKTGRSRTIALPPSTIAALKAWRTNQVERRLATRRWHNFDLVLDRGDGGVLPQNTVARAHQRICIEAGVPIIRLHDVRHTAATLLLESGTNIKVVSDLLGHAQIATTADIYMHVSWDVQMEATSTLADVLERNA